MKTGAKLFLNFTEDDAPKVAALLTMLNREFVMGRANDDFIMLRNSIHLTATVEEQRTFYESLVNFSPPNRID